MGLDLVGLVQKIFIESFYNLELVDQPLELIHPKNCNDLRIHYHHYVDCSPLHQCLDVVMLLGVDVQSYIHDIQP